MCGGLSHTAVLLPGLVHHRGVWRVEGRSKCAQEASQQRKAQSTPSTKHGPAIAVTDVIWQFTLLNKGDFWLAENPDVPAKGWDATCCNRIVSWVNLRDNASGKEFFFFSAHYDHQGEVARRESSKLVLKKIREIAKGKPTILVGDLNADHDSEPYEILQGSKLLTDAYTLVNEPYHNNGSFSSFKKSNNMTVIDHVFVTSGIEVEKWGILTDSYFGKYPSDHFPVVSVVKLP